MVENFLGSKVPSDTPLNILLVEDNEADVKISLRAFQQAKLKNMLFVVNDGQECLDFVRQEGNFADAAKFPAPDLILLDINMPRVDGFEVLKTLKADPRYRMIPVIMFSASKNQHDVKRSYDLGANSFIQKPVEYEEFVSSLECFNQYWHVLNKLPARKN